MISVTESVTEDRKTRNLSFSINFILSSLYDCLKLRLHSRTIESELQSRIGEINAHRVSVSDFAAVIRELPISSPWTLLAQHRLLIITIYAFNIVAIVLNNEISSLGRRRGGENGRVGGSGTTSRGKRGETRGTNWPHVCLFSRGE